MIRKRKPKNKRNDSNINVGYYVVAFIDLLGQQERMRNLRELPSEQNAGNRERLRQTVAETYGAVVRMREDISTAISGFLESDELSPKFSALTKENRAEIRRLLEVEIDFQPFSDSIVVYTPLADSAKGVPAKAVFGIMSAVGTAASVAVARKNPIRGAIEVGVGIVPQEKELYGPALARAYALESNVADYPRILIGDELVEYLEVLASQSSNDILSRASAALAKDALRIITEDDDGYPILDYLGPQMAAHVSEFAGEELIERGYEFIKEELDRFRDAKNTKLVSRYTRLKAYFDKNKYLWKQA